MKAAAEGDPMTKTELIAEDHTDIDPMDFNGKTIKKLVAPACNYIEFYFTDGTAIAIEVDGIGYGLYGMVACKKCPGEKA